MKILIIPKPDVSFYDLFYDAGWIPKPNLAKLKWYYKFDQVAYEYNYYSDICKVNDGETHMLGNLHAEYLKPPPINCTNPSARRCPPVTSIRYSTAIRDLASYDAILCSSWSVEYSRDLLRQARKKGVIVAIIDHADHEDIFITKDSNMLTRGLNDELDFDLYFKKDLPLGMAKKNLLPLGPDPVRPLSYEYELSIPQNERPISVFFSGIVNKPTTREQRDGLLQKVENTIDFSYINIIDVDDHYSKKNLITNSQLYECMAKSKIVLCAPGRAWTTTRLTASAIFGCVPMIAEPDCELVDMDFYNNDFSIKYKNLRYLKGDDRNKAINEAVEVLKYAISNEKKLEQMSKKWKDLVHAKHTTTARAAYIVNTIKKAGKPNF
jgi:hypothetical protein